MCFESKSSPDMCEIPSDKDRHGCTHTCNSRQRKPESSKTLLWSIMGTLASSSSQTSESRHQRLHGDLTPRHGVIKYCDEFPGFTRYKLHRPYGASSSKRISVPRSHAKHPTDTYPDASETSVRKAISTFLPRFANRRIFNKTMCWCTDTADAALLICEHPKWRNLILATGDSGYVSLPDIFRGNRQG